MPDDKEDAEDGNKKAGDGQAKCPPLCPEQSDGGCLGVCFKTPTVCTNCDCDDGCNDQCLAAKQNTAKGEVCPTCDCTGKCHPECQEVRLSKLSSSSSFTLILQRRFGRCEHSSRLPNFGPVSSRMHQISNGSNTCPILDIPQALKILKSNKLFIGKKECSMQSTVCVHWALQRRLRETQKDS